ncbi:MAG TPA: ROK family protein [Myxococcaceae bacterium]|jgi:polyphosphate glucokinase|nr:ROK family protein [Myxococcaceae bacterium]
MPRATPELPKPRTPRTLSIDIGGTGVKALVLASGGEPLTERVRVETPRPATPRRLLQAIWALVEPLGPFERVSVGFPGVVVEGVTRTAPNLHPDWAGYPLARTLQDRFRRPTRVVNDAGLQGYGVVEGRGVEMLLTFGTGMGCALFNEGVYVPNLELAHHPFRKAKTYEDYVSARALAAVGKRRWNRRVGRVVAQVLPIFNPRRLYLGGGNAKHITLALPPEVHLVANIAGLLGGIALWRGQDRA